MADAMAALTKLRNPPEEAAAILFRTLAEGTLVGRANHMTTQYTDGTTQEHVDHVVPAGLLALGPMPPLGHDFWRKGDVRVAPGWLPDGSVVRIGGQTIPVPLGGLLPVFIIRGFRVSRDGVLALCRALCGVTVRGRRKGVGSLALIDGPVLLEMRRLIGSPPAMSIHQAAWSVVDRAAGHGTDESKVKRLMRRYQEQFPER